VFLCVDFTSFTGPLGAKDTMRLVAKIRQSELRNARGVDRARAFYGAVRKAYGKR
jgi:hypothetical protein